MNELKPCPFCDGEVKLIYNPDTESYEVCCSECHSEFRQYRGCRDGAIVAWNRRVGETND